MGVVGPVIVVPMRNKERLEKLRAEALRLERNAGRKMSRIRNRDIQPVELAGSKYDARKGASKVRGMRTRDLEVHIRRLESFNKSGTGYIATGEGIAGPEIVDRYRRARARVNRKREKMLEKYGDLPTSNKAETYSQVFGKTEAKIRKMSDPAVNNPFRKIEDANIQFAGPKALERMAEKFEFESSDGYDAERTAKNRETLQKIIDVLDQAELQTVVDGMTDEQFDLMWFDPAFMQGEGLAYAVAMGTLGKKGEEMSDRQRQAFEDAAETDKERSLEIARRAATL